MLITLWSVKGGSGVSVVAAGLASLLSKDGAGGDGDGTLLVDLAGDQPALLGLPATSGPGVHDWLSSTDADARALRRLEVEVSGSLSLLPCGRPGPPGAAEAGCPRGSSANGGSSARGWSSGREVTLAAALEADRRAVVVDGGLGEAPVPAIADMGVSLLVVRPCYLALRRAVRSAVEADGAVLVEEAGRALDAVDVSRALGLPVLCSVQADATVARAVDAGLLSSRLPRAFARSLRAIA